ncbi:hypothetical protein U1763_19615 [Sphingomonas sp. LB2R24]|uniref:hypothetical protein n=1 Tax=Sphingomonas sorbitolis TaxID=3096165 RepID=UPI002FC5EC29
MSGVTLNILIESALLQRPYHQQRLGLQAARYCRAITNRFCADFPEDRHEEVLGQAFAELMSAGSDALTIRSGLSVFRRAIFAAIRIVRADYAPPGHRTRRMPADTLLPKVAAEDIGRIADRQAIERCTIGEVGDRHLDLDLLENHPAAAAIKQCEDRVDAEWALRRAPPNVAKALRLIYLDDAPVSVAAHSVGLSRFALHRQMTTFTALWRSAA